MLRNKLMGAAGGSSTDPYFNNVSLLLHGDGTNGSQSFQDNSNNSFAVTANGNAQISTSVKKFGTGSIYFDGTGDYLTVPASNDWVTSTNGSVTIEFWAYAISNGYYYLLDIGTGNQAAIAIGFSNGSGYIYWYSGVVGAHLGNVTGLSNATGAWNHYAFVLNSGVPRIYLNGIQALGTYTSNTGFGVNDTLNIARYVGSSIYNFYGYIDDFLITKGVARYTANFTPPTQAFPNQ